VTGLAGNLIFVLSLLLFLGVESATASTRLAGVEAERPAMAEALRRFAHGTRRFLVVTTAIGLITGLVDYVILSVMGVPLALLWGLLVFITNDIPYVGFWIGLAPPFLLALLAGGVSRALVVLGVFVVVNFVLTSLIQPKIVGDAVGLSVSLTLVALVFWAWLLGPLGAVLAVPLTLLAKQVLVDANPRVRWLNFLVGGAPPTTAGALAPSPDPSPPDHTASADHPPDADTASPGEDVPTATSGPPTSRDDGP
jgi:predicted PurR-regulated permease PerM